MHELDTKDDFNCPALSASHFRQKKLEYP